MILEHIKDPYVGYRMSYPKTYKNNIYLTKFEKDHFTRDFSTTRGWFTRLELHPELFLIILLFKHFL